MNIVMKLFTKAHTWIYRSSGGRRGTMMNGEQLILLTTTGNKSGKPRTNPVVPFFEGNQMYIMASMAGAPTNPAWYTNLCANPDVGVQRGPETWRARAEVVEGAERDRLWKAITTKLPAFGEYEKKTTRVIPVVRLVRQG